MDLIGNYSSQQPSPGPASPQNVRESEGDENVISTASEHATEDTDNIYMTQESEDDGSGTEESDADASDAEDPESDPDSLTPPPYSLPTPPVQNANSPELFRSPSPQTASPHSPQAHSPLTQNGEVEDPEH